MTTDLTGLALALGIQLNAAATKENDLSTVTDSLGISENLATAFGAAAGLADQIVYGQYDLAKVGAGDDVTLDLEALTNAFGVAVNFASIKLVLIINRSLTGAILEIGNGAEPFKAWHKVATEIDTLGQDDVSLHTKLDAGWATAGAKDLMIVNIDAAEAAVFDIVLIGVSA